MKFRTALSALTAIAIAGAAPALALAETATPAATGNVVASTPVPNPPEKAKTTKIAKAHHVSKTSHRRHKALASAAAKPAPAHKAKVEKSSLHKAPGHKPTVKKASVRRTATAGARRS